MTKITIDRATVDQVARLLNDLEKGKAAPTLWQVHTLLDVLQKALEQPEQEPIGYLWPTGMHPEFRYTKQKRDGVDGTPVYTAPPAAQPEHGDIRALKYRIHELEGEVIGYKRMIEEAALRKLADLGQEIEQEPVACLSKNQAKAILDLALDLEKTGRLVSLTEGQERSNFVTRNRAIQCALEDALRNATTPPAAQRKPLTDAEIRSIHDTYYRRMGPQEFARAIEAAHGIKEGT